MPRRRRHPRSHHRRDPLPPRRGAHPDGPGCFVIRPPVADDDVFLAVCEQTGLWRIVAPPFDAHGAIDPDAGLEGLHEALAQAVDELRHLRPDVAQAFERLLSSMDE